METFGRYELLRKLATGGMGQVFLARQTGPVGFQKLLVVKRLLPHLSEDPEFIHMFLDEARIAGVLNHPNIAQIYDLGDVDGVLYIAMEYVHGEAVSQVNVHARQRKGGLPLGLKCRIIADAAAGLGHAHQARTPSGRKLGLIHRDVSPQNVLVGFNGNVKLIDFGVAKAVGKLSQTVVGTIKGKHAYMSPEQARGEELDARSDVYGLGTVFYELLTHQRLFKRDTDMATLKAVVGARVLPPSEVVPGVPKSLDAVVMKALARRREERFQSAGDFQLALEDFLVSERLAGTQAHLTAFMKELYATELEEERFASEPTVIQFDPRLSREISSSSETRVGPAQAPAPRPKPSAASPAPARKPQTGGSTPGRPAAKVPRPGDDGSKGK
ncbi:Serine/threonine-protein kinase Pkn6 [Cystobacter fuscus]|uniref:Serine/threonine-protein kinase Pkn6 n=1 Tax=Cystobacter fuscus TaxID=43 RepID=A0A250JGX6_9BACT|nr:serine/threonine-protein kinase [Cystobacter fuscus]ATB42870.1 Serine/threonine-protein kinase Pkn6 [Cystobacter fuscus]